MDINAIAVGKPQYVARKLRLQRFRTITEVSLGGTDMRRVRHGIFPLLGKTENIVGQFSTLGSVQYIICHNQLFFVVNIQNKNISHSRFVGIPAAPLPKISSTYCISK